MLVELNPPDSIRPYDKNPRKNDPAVEAVMRSLKEFGFRQPIVVDSQGVIIVGHTRWKAACKLGLTQVPVHVATALTSRRLRPTWRRADLQTRGTRYFARYRCAGTDRRSLYRKR